MDVNDDDVDYVPSPPMEQGSDDEEEYGVDSPPSAPESNHGNALPEDRDNDTSQQQAPISEIEAPQLEAIESPLAQDMQPEEPDEEDAEESLDPVETERRAVLKMAQQPDAILEPNVISLVQRYQKVEGTAEQLMRTMADSFVDFPAKTELLMQAMVDSGCEALELEEHVNQSAQDWVLQHFDTDVVNEEIAQQRQAQGSVGFVLPVLDAMLSHSRWRKVFATLAQDSSKESFFFTQGLKALVARGNHQSAAELSRLAQDQDLFVEVLLKELKACLTAATPADYNVHLSILVTMAQGTLATYSLVQCLLVSLHNQVERSDQLAVEALSEAIETAVSASGLDVGHISHLLVTRAPAHAEAVGLLSTMVTGSSVAMAEVHRLYQLYAGEHAPPAGLLQRRRILEVLLNALFKGHKLAPDHLKKYSCVLSIAVTFPSDHCPADLASSPSHQQLDTLLQQVHNVLHFGSLTPSSLATLNTGLDYPVIAQGLLLWLQQVMTQDQFFLTFSSTSPPAHMRVLDQVVQRQPQLYQHVIRVIMACLTSSYSIDATVLAEAYKCLMDRLLVVIAQGYAPACLAAVMAQVDRINLPVLSYFLERLIAMVEPPLSDLFLDTLLPLLQRYTEVLPAAQKLPVWFTDFVSIASAALDNDNGNSDRGAELHQHKDRLKALLAR